MFIKVLKKNLDILLFLLFLFLAYYFIFEFRYQPRLSEQLRDLTIELNSTSKKVDN